MIPSLRVSQPPAAHPLKQPSPAEAATQYRATVSILDKSVQKGVLHKNTASRYKGRLNARVKALVLKAA